MKAQNAQKAPRRPGRPAGKTPGNVRREQLMDSALRLFAQQGVAHISLNAIAKEAGVTPAMLHYYFSSRESLVEQLLEERFLPLRNDIATVFADNPHDPMTAFTRMVEKLAALAQEHDWFAPLWLQEMVGEIPVLRQHLQARFGDEKYHQMLDTIRGWQQAGKLHNDLSPELLITSLASLVLVPFSRLAHDERLQSVSPQTIVRHALTMMQQGICA